jgi:hypothetical protein
MPNNHSILIWTGRVAGILFYVVSILFTARSGVLWVKTSAETGETLIHILIALSFFGYIWSWFRMRKGAWMMLVSGLLLGALFLIYGDISSLLFIVLPLCLIALCFMAAAEGWLV